MNKKRIHGQALVAAGQLLQTTDAEFLYESYEEDVATAILEEVRRIGTQLEKQGRDIVRKNKALQADLRGRR